MKNKSSISRVLAFGIMLLLSVSMLPQKTVHEWLGCHKDRSVQTLGTDDQLQVSKQTLHCSCDQPEFQSPFIISSFFYTSSHKVFISLGNEDAQEAKHCTLIQTALLRGPPAASHLF